MVPWNQLIFLLFTYTLSLLPGMNGSLQEGLMSSPERRSRSISPARIQVRGIRGLSLQTLDWLKNLSPQTLTKLESQFASADHNRTGTVSSENFKKAVSYAQTNATPEDLADIMSAYALDREEAQIWWAAFLRETISMRNSNGLINSPTSPSRRPWEGLVSPKGGGVPGCAAPYYDYVALSSQDSPIQPSVEYEGEAQQLLMELACFFQVRRVDVADAFTDFELPGRFCKGVRRVTRFQFKEVLYFITKGLSGLTEDHIHLLSSIFDDGTGLIRYREFIRAVDLALEPPTTSPQGGAGAKPHANDSSPAKVATLATGSPRLKSPMGSPTTSSRLPLLTGRFSTARSQSEMLFNSASGNVQDVRSGSPGRRSPSPIAPLDRAMTEEFATKTAKLLGVQPMGPEACQLPMRIHVYHKPDIEEILAKIRQILQISNILLKDHLSLWDKHKEGCITYNNFRRQMDQLRVFKIKSDEFELLERTYPVRVDGAEVRFDYPKFCADLQPHGPDIEEKIAALPRDLSKTSPLATKKLAEDEMRDLFSFMNRLANVVRHKRIEFRAFFSDWDRTCKTRSGTTPFNYTLHAGCVSRSQFQQALAKMQLQSLVDADILTIMYKKYDREGDFNHLMFIRDLDEYIAAQELEEESAISNRNFRLKVT